MQQQHQKDLMSKLKLKSTLNRQMRLVINTTGTTQTVASDDLSFVDSLGDCDVRRASHVEAVKHDGKSMWETDLFPVGGPVLGPFQTRTEALQKEVEWLDQRLGSLEFNRK
jgi:hypothetical protein